MPFGRTLQRIRRAKRKTQKDIADAIGMDYAYFSRLENDHFDYTPTRETVKKMAAALNCSEPELHELLSEADRIDEEMEKVAKLAHTRPELRELFRAAAKLSPDQVKQLIEGAQRRRGPTKKEKR
jgi:transcriptional regulator with XRE-family HTH domain